MAETIGSGEIITALVLIKAVLAILAVLLFLYYKFYWEKAKRHMPIHFFYTKWRAVRHAVFLGMAAIGFAVGFTLEIFGVALGMSASLARGISSLFEIGSLVAMLWVFFQLALEDVPHFAHIAESSALRKRQWTESTGAARRHAHHAPEMQKIAVAKNAKKKARKRGR